MAINNHGEFVRDTDHSNEGENPDREKALEEAKGSKLAEEIQREFLSSRHKMINE